MNTKQIVAAQHLLEFVGFFSSSTFHRNKQRELNFAFGDSDLRRVWAEALLAPVLSERGMSWATALARASKSGNISLWYRHYRWYQRWGRCLQGAVASLQWLWSTQLRYVQQLLPIQKYRLCLACIREVLTGVIWYLFTVQSFSANVLL